MTLLDWINYKAEKLTDADKVWLFAKIGTNLQRRKFAIWCARQCETEVKKIKEFTDTAEKYYIYKTVTKEELDKACNAAYRAAGGAAYSAAYWAADRIADRAAFNAAYSVVYSVARKKQVEKIKNLLKGKE